MAFRVFRGGEVERGGGEEGGVLEHSRKSSEEKGALSNALGEEGTVDEGATSLAGGDVDSSYMTPLSAIRIRFRGSSISRLLETRWDCRV